MKPEQENALIKGLGTDVNPPHRKINTIVIFNKESTGEIPLISRSCTYIEGHTPSHRKNLFEVHRKPILTCLIEMKTGIIA
jgi:hypothetical protein